MEPNIFDWIYDLPISIRIAEGVWEYPALEVIHIYSMIFLISAAMLFDLALMGYQVGRDTISHVAKIALRWTWICFGINFVSGTLLFMSRAPEYSRNWAFQLKLALVFVGMVFHTVLLRKAIHWEETPTLAFGSKLLVGGVSLLIWVGVIAASRWIAYAIPEFL